MKVRQWLKRLIMTPSGPYVYHKGGGVTRSIGNLTDLAMDASQSQEIVIPRPHPEEPKK